MANILSDVGRAALTALLASSANKWVGWGTGAGTAAATDTTLFTESAESRVSGTQTQQTTTVTDDTYQVVGLMTASATRAITNAGVFDASTAGNLFLKGDHATVNLNSGEQIQYTFKLQFT